MTKKYIAFAKEVNWETSAFLVGVYLTPLECITALQNKFNNLAKVPNQNIEFSWYKDTELSDPLNFSIVKYTAVYKTGWNKFEIAVLIIDN